MLSGDVGDSCSFSSSSFLRCSSVLRLVVLSDLRFLMASSTWWMAFSRPERLLHQVNIQFFDLSSPNTAYVLLHALLSANVEFRYHAFRANVLAPLADRSIFIATTLNFALAAVEARCLFGAHAVGSSWDVWRWMWMWRGKGGMNSASYAAVTRVGKGK